LVLRNEFIQHHIITLLLYPFEIMTLL